jgi:trigger factor
MRTGLIRILSLAPALFCLTLFAFAAPQRSAQADLNGDGKAEQIKLTIANEDTGQFTLTIGNQTVKDECHGVDSLQVVDIDKGDKIKEVNVFIHGDSDYNENWVYWYDSKAIRLVAKLNGAPNFAGSLSEGYPGNGIVYVKELTSFWNPLDKYALNANTHTLELVKQPFYYVGITAVVEKSIPIYADEKMKTAVATLLPKSKVEILLNDALDIVVPDKYYAAVKELELQTAGDPDIEVGYVVKGEPVLVKVMVPLYPQVMLGQLEGLKVKVPQLPPVTDEDVERSLAATMRENRTFIERKKEPAVMGDQVTIDFEGKVGKKDFQGEKDHKVLLGADTFIPGFDEKLVGVKKGDSLQIAINFDDDHPASDLAGQTAIFDVLVKKVEEIKEMVMDENFLKNVAQVDSMEQFRSDLKKKLAENADKRQEELVRQAVSAAAVEASDVQVPEALVMEAATNTMQQFLQQLQAEGGDLELYAQMIGKSVDEVKRDFWTDAQRSVKINYLLEKIVSEKGFNISEDEQREGILEFARQYNMDSGNYEDLKKRVGPMLEKVSVGLKAQKAVQYLVDHAEVTLVDPKDMQSKVDAPRLN